MGHRQTLFDRWASNYDASIHDADFPFLGYDRVLETIVRLARTEPGTAVLDLGIGTANLAERLLASIAGRIDLWGFDFSPTMLAKARSKLPGATLIRADLLTPVWPGELARRFHRVVSAYVFHEFDLQAKLDLLKRLANDALAPDGRIVIGDIAFPTVELRAAAHRRWEAWWDEEEAYWAADEILPAMERLGLQVTYEQVSACAGVFVLTRS